MTMKAGHGLICMMVLTALACLPMAAPAQTTWSLTPWTILINTNNIVNAATYGAVGDGVTTNTTAIQSAINAAATGGTTNGLSGGTVEIPAGTYICGPLTLKSAVNLQIDAGAILRMLPFGQYPMTFTTNGSTITWSAPTFISASSLHDVEISGSGAIDGQGAPWWPYSSVSGDGRAVMIGPNSCNRLLIQGVTLSNSPEFHIAIGGSSHNVTVQNVTVMAPSSSPNTDACDVSGTNVLIQNNHISEGDDDFTCGGGTSDVLLTNNTYGTGHGISIGSYTDGGGVSNILVINCTMNGAVNGIRLKSDNDRGGVVQNLEYCNIGMTNVNFPIQAYAYYDEVGTPSSITPYLAATTTVAAVTGNEPTYRNILYSNINATANSGYPAIILWARTERPGTNFVFDRVNISASRPVEVYNFQKVQFIDSQFTLPGTIATFNVFDSQIIISNSAQNSALEDVDGISTNGYLNALSLFNGVMSYRNTNVYSGSSLTLGNSTLTVSNNLSLASSTLNYYLGTNTATVAVTGNLTLGGTINVTDGGGFTNQTYSLLTYGQTLSGSTPALGTFPTGYGGTIDTSSPGAVNLIVTNGTQGTLPATPANVSAAGGNGVVTVTWSAVSTATNYVVQRSSTSSSSGYVIATNTTGTNYIDTQVTNGTTYYYEVAADNANGRSSFSSAVSAMPQSATVVANANVFGDVFSSSTVDSGSPALPTPTSTSYEIVSSKTWSPGPSIGAKHLKFGIGTTTSGIIEAQALFTNAPVTLVNTGDSLSLIITFTNTSGILAESGSLGFGLYNSGQNLPVAGGMNGTLSSSSTGNATGNAQTWAGYVGQLSYTGIASQILTRPAQSGANDSSQELLTTGSSSSYLNGATVGTASTGPSVALTAGNPYTEEFTITLEGPDTLAVTNALYFGTSTNGTLLSQFGGIASGSTFITNSFDALAFGWRAEASTLATSIDVNQIAVNTGAAVNSILPPSAPTNLQAAATNLLINLQWNAVSGANTYNLKRGTATSGPYPTVFGGLITTNYADTNVMASVPYYYIVTAVNTAGESTNSIEATATPLPSNQPSNVVFQVSGNQLQLSWPSNQLGWVLQMQTNSPGSGLGTNWVDVPNSTNVTSTNILVDPTQGNVFYRLVYQQP